MSQGSLNDLSYLYMTEKKLRSELDGNGNFLYLGYASPGYLTSDAKWQIRKFTWDGTFTSMPRQIDWASGNDNFDKVWDNRSSYVYS
jgi:hypothetical protein